MCINHWPMLTCNSYSTPTDSDFVLGYEVNGKRANTDQFKNTLIVPNPSEPIDKDAVIKSWHFYANTPGRICLFVSLTIGSTQLYVIKVKNEIACICNYPSSGLIRAISRNDIHPNTFDLPLVSKIDIFTFTFIIPQYISA